MPKVFSQKEKEYIKQRLKEEAASCLALYGIKKTTVDELVKRVNIPKGTFYLFYESKELLMFDVINDLHEGVETKLFDSISQAKGEITVDMLTDWITQMYMDTMNSGILRILGGGDLEILARKLPDEVLQEHMGHDIDLLSRLAKVIPKIQDKDLELYTAAFRSLFAMIGFQNGIGAKQFEEVVHLTIRGIVMQLLEER